MATSKQYVIIYKSENTNKELFFVGTTGELLEKFSETLHKGNISVFNTVHLYPNSITSLVANLNKSVENLRGKAKPKRYSYRVLDNPV